MENSQVPSSRRNLDDARNSTKNIPFDLTLEILSKLPVKSLIRFQAVSKLWFSIIRSKDFTDSFLTRSKTRPRLLFTFKHFDSRKRFIFSAPEPGNDYDNKASTVVARHDMTISDLVYYIRCRPVNGFICFTRGSSIAVCNPTTRQIVKLPDVVSNGRLVYARLGYDPVQDQYKVLCVMMFNGISREIRDIKQEHFVFTLSSQQKEWRKIEITQGLTYGTVDGGICIDGVIYYGDGYSKIVRFDVRSETLELIQAPEDSGIASTYVSTLINYNGKLAGVDYHEMILWILVDAEKQEWSEMTCALSYELDDLIGEYVRSEGEIYTGELMIPDSRLNSSKPLSVCYYDFSRESLRKVDVEGIADDEFRRVYGIGKRTRAILSFPGYVENIRFLRVMSFYSFILICFFHSILTDGELVC